MSAMSVAALPLPAHATAAAVMAMHGSVSETSALPPPPPPASVVSFPVTKVSGSVTPGLGRKAGTVNITYRSTIPGLSFCIGYAGAHGAVIPYTSDGEHCVIAGRDGLVQDSVFVNIGSPDALLIANIVLIDNRVSTETVPVGASVQTAR